MKFIIIAAFYSFIALTTPYNEPYKKSKEQTRSMCVIISLQRERREGDDVKIGVILSRKVYKNKNSEIPITAI
jgi:hypothetical protein